MRVVFLDRATFARDIVFSLAHTASCQWKDYPTTRPEEIQQRARNAEVLIVNKIRIDRKLLGQLPALRLIAITATGFDNVDLTAAQKHGIAVCNVADYAAHSVPEHVFTMLLALKRNLFRYHDALRSGSWPKSSVYCLHTYPIEDLVGNTLGIVGAGTLGRAVARLGEAFGMSSLLADRRGAKTIRPGRVPFDEVLATSDVVSLHVPLTEETRLLIGTEELARMKPGAVLINAARGGVVDEAALLAALQTGHLGGACIDVLSQEPPAADHPLLTADLPKLIVTPHIAWASRQTQQRLADEVMANIAAFLKGERRNRLV